MVRWYVDPSFNAQEDEFLISAQNSIDSEINFESKALNWGDEYLETFSKCGRIDYFDSTYSFMQGSIIISSDYKLWSKCDKSSEIESSRKNHDKIDNSNNSSSCSLLKSKQINPIPNQPPLFQKERKTNSSISPLSQLSKSKCLSLFGSFDLHSSSSSLQSHFSSSTSYLTNNNNNKTLNPLFGSFSQQYKSVNDEEKKELNSKSIIESFTLPFITSITNANQEVQKNHKKKKKNSKKKKNKRKRNNSKNEIKNETNSEKEIENDSENEVENETNENRIIELKYSSFDYIELIDNRIEPFEIVTNSSEYFSSFIININNQNKQMNKFSSFLISKWNDEMMNMKDVAIVSRSDSEDIYCCNVNNSICSYFN